MRQLFPKCVRRKRCCSRLACVPGLERVENGVEVGVSRNPRLRRWGRRHAYLFASERFHHLCSDNVGDRRRNGIRHLAMLIQIPNATTTPPNWSL